ncbi:alanine:cation symporter family protein [Metabacillus fastidiosus]
MFVAVTIFLFTFSSIIGNYYYGETDIEFLSGDRLWITLLKY